MSTSAALKVETRFLGLPKNRTGLFAADTVHEVKSTRNHSVNVPALSPQFRQNGTINFLLASAEQNRHQLQQYRLSSREIQQYYVNDETPGTNIDSSNDSRRTNNGIRNGFRPSPIRHQRTRLNTGNSQRINHQLDTRDSSSKSIYTQSPTSAKFRSEMIYINNTLLKKKDSRKSLRLQNNQELDDSPRSALSYSTSHRASSASTQLTADRIHQRFSSAITRFTANTQPTINSMNNQTPQLPSGLITQSPPLTIRETDEHDESKIEEHPTHAYQIPQRSNVGSESIFFTNSSPISSIKTRSAKNNNRHPSDSKSVSCPFYVMYFTNLTMQQRQTNETNGTEDDNERIPFANSSGIRKVPVNSRSSTAHQKRPLNRRQLNSPISINTFSTLDDDDKTATSMSIPVNKRTSMRISPMMENENTHSLRDILRTTAWNHVQV